MSKTGAGPILLGVDIGTTRCKAGAYTADGRQLALAASATPVHDDGDGQAHWEPEEIWKTVARLIREVTGRLDHPERIAAVSTSTVGEAGALVDADGRPLTAMIAWYDPRTIAQREWWDRTFSPRRLAQQTGLPPDHIYTLQKILWWREHAPEAFSRAHRWLGVGEWVAYRLSGVMSANYSVASRSMALDLRHRRWSEEILRHAGISPSLLGELVPSGTPIGRIRPEVARDLGLAPDTQVVAGGHDHICAAFAVGVVESGDLFNSTGTAETMLAAMQELPPSLDWPGVTFGHHVVADRYYAMTTLRSSGLSVEWAIATLLGDTGPDRYARFLDALSRGRGVEDGLVFFPFLRGNLVPHDQPLSGGAWVGLRDHHRPEDLARAVMEGVVFEGYAMLDHLRGLGIPVAPVLRVVGGGTHNPVWLQLKADVMGIDIEVPAVGEAAVLGAALLGGIGCGVYRDAAEAYRRTYQVASRHSPDRSRQAAYAKGYAAYRELRDMLLSWSQRLRQEQTSRSPWEGRDVSGHHAHTQPGPGRHHHRGGGAPGRPQPDPADSL